MNDIERTDDTLLSDGHEVLFRQVHPDLIQHGVPGYVAFRPGPRDEGQLSVDRSTLTTPEASYVLHTEGKGKKSAGTWGLTVDEFRSVQRPCYSDPVEAEDDMPANPAHAVAIYDGLDKKEMRKIGLALAELAMARGLLHPHG